MLRDNNATDKNITATSVGTWANLLDGYAKITVNFAAANVVGGPLMAYCTGGSLTVTFS